MNDLYSLNKVCLQCLFALKNNQSANMTFEIMNQDKENYP